MPYLFYLFPFCSVLYFHYAKFTPSITPRGGL
nr:MAG TPA: hypothetical protein [Caudoviricetes sp.]